MIYFVFERSRVARRLGTIVALYVVMFKKAFGRFSLRVAITAVFAVLLGVMAGLTWFLTWRNAQVSIRELAGQIGRQSMINIRRHLEDYIVSPKLVNEINELALKETDASATSQDKLLRRFIAELSRYPSTVSIAYANEQGEYFGISRGIEGVPLSLGLADRTTGGYLEGYRIDENGFRLGRFDRSSAPFDPRRRPWYLSALATGAPTWTPVYLWLTGDAGLDAVTPIRDRGGRLLGVLDTSLTLSGIGAFLQGVRATPHAEAFILEKSGMLVAASSIEKPYLQTDGQLQRIAAVQSADPVIRLSAAEILRALAVPGRLSGETQFSFTAGGVRQDLRVAPFSDGQGLDWLIAEAIPESDLAQNIYQDMRTTAVFVALFLLLSMAIALFLARRIGGPLKTLSEMARSFAKGDLGHPILVEGTDEVGELAASFNVLGEELRQSFGSLAASEARYRTLFEGMPVGLFRTDAEGTIEQANARMRSMFGFSDDESLAGVNAFSLIGSPEDRERLRVVLERDGSVQDTDVQMIRRDGGLFWARAHARLARAGGDGTVHYEGSMVDVTERRNAEQALRQSEAKYRDIFHRSAVSLWEADTSELHSALDVLSRSGTTDLAGYMAENPVFVAQALRMINIVDVNETTVRLFEARSREELLGPLSVSFDDAALAGPVPAAIMEVRSGMAHDLETTVMTRTGRPLRVIVHFSVPAKTDSFSNLLVSMIDITTRTQAEEARTILEEQLRHAQKVETIGRIASGISHDINNLLTPILGNCELLLMGPPDSDEQKGAAHQILGATLRIRDLTSKLLAYSRKQPLAMKVVDLRAVVREFEPLLRRALRSSIRMRVVDACDDGLVRVDPGQIEQVLMNLAVNAQDAMAQGGTLTFTLGRGAASGPLARSNREAGSDSYVTLSVSDTGHGMDEKTREHIFEPFFTTKASGKGTGLGLSVVYGIVKQHGGLIQVESAPGVGTAFTIFIPACTES